MNNAFSAVIASHEAKQSDTKCRPELVEGPPQANIRRDPSLRLGLRLAEAGYGLRRQDDAAGVRLPQSLRSFAMTDRAIIHQALGSVYGFGLQKN